MSKLKKPSTFFLKDFPQRNYGLFRRQLLDWFKKNGRHHLPWKPHPTLSIKQNLYRIWVSEIMLQQTQVKTVISYFARFTKRFPTIESLANSSLEEVLHIWQGLGYYSRARNLHLTAQKLVNHYQGTIPNDFKALIELNGIGKTTAAAILSQGYNAPYAILDGNVKRVLARILGCTAPKNRLDTLLTPYADKFLSKEHPADYTQAIMDFGATICKPKPLCKQCFFQSHCLAYQTEQVTSLPRPQVKKTRPHKALNLLIFERHQFQTKPQAYTEILLEKREAKGIWGGLYSLPEFKISQQPIDICEKEGITPQKIEAIPSFQHHFSHYTLNATPFVVKIEYNTPISPNISSLNTVWIDTRYLKDYPLPTPISTLLSTLYP